MSLSLPFASRGFPAALVVASSLALAACSGANPAAPLPVASEVPADGTATPGPMPSASPAAPEVREPVWTTDIGSESWAAPAVDGDTVYVASNDGVVRALNVADGSVTWEFETSGDLRGAVAPSSGNLFFVGDDGTLYAVDSTGNELWRVPFFNAVEVRDTFNNHGSRPYVRDGVVYAAGLDGTVIAVDEADGTVFWTAALDGSVEANIAMGDGRIHVSTMAGLHYALDAATGVEVWRLLTAAPASTSPAVFGDLIAIGSRSANLQIRSEVTGEKVWTQKMGGSWVQSGATAIDDETLVIGSSDLRAIRAYSITTGDRVWETEVGGWPWGVPAVADGVVYESELRIDYLQPWDTAFYALDAASGDVLWTASGGEALEWAPDDMGMYGNAAGPVVSGNLVIVAGLDGMVRAYER